jgi:AcrR family transcriptional regulator
MDVGQKKSSATPAGFLSAGIAPQSYPAVPGRRERRAAETRLRLFRCALQLFAERGYSNVTVEDITEAADVGKGTFFNYFETKDHVLGVMAEIQLGKVRQAVQDAAVGKDSIRTVLHRMVIELAKEPGRSPGLARTMISSFLASDGVRKIIGRNMQDGRKMLAGVIAAGQRSGEIDPHLKSHKIAAQFQQSVMGTMLFWSLHEAPALKTCIEDTFQLLWRSIAANGEKQES